MKKYIYLLFFVSCLGGSVKAQVLWSEDFSSYTVGFLNPINFSQNGSNVNYLLTPENWLLCAVPHTSSPTPTFQVSVESEASRGNIFKIQDIPIQNVPMSNLVPNLYVSKEIPQLETLWSNRTIGNDILKYECDFYIDFQIRNTSLPTLEIGLGRMENSVTLNQYNYFPSTVDFTYFAPIRELSGHAIGTSNGQPRLSSVSLNPFNWTKVIIYVDFTTGFVHFEVPSLNIAYRSDSPLSAKHLKALNLWQIVFISDAASNNGNRASHVVKLDDFKVSAVNTLPLSLTKLAAGTFNVFPNPTTDVAVIKSNENIFVKQIEVLDIGGKVVKTQTFNSENDVQLSLVNLASGTYVLLIHTNVGTASEKIIKN